MNTQIRKGLGFGLTSGVITTLGLIVGLDASTGSRLAVVAGILVIAIADAFSDAMGMHISEEATYKKTERQIWQATISTFIFKFIVALTFVLPFLLFTVFNAVLISVVWGLFLIMAYSYELAKKTRTAPRKVISEHVLLTIVVIIASYLVGKAAAVIV